MIVTSKQGEYLSSGCKEKQRTRVHPSKPDGMKGGAFRHTNSRHEQKPTNLREFDIEDIGIISIQFFTSRVPLLGLLQLCHPMAPCNQQHLSAVESWNPGNPEILGMHLGILDL